jgi:hypothetical protein
LIGEVKLPFIAEQMIGFSLFTAHSFLFSGIFLDEYGLPLFKTMLPLFGIDFIVGFFPRFPGISTYILFAYLAGVAIHKRKFIKCAKAFWVKLLLMYAYQAVILVIKTGHMHVGYNMLTTYENLMLCIDNLIFTALLYGIGGAKHYGQRLERFIHPEEISSDVDDQEDRDEVAAWQQLQGFVRFRAVALLLLFQLLQWGLILFVCKIGNVLVEGVVMSGSFVVYGLFVKNRWHSKSLIVCTLTTCAMFYVAARAIPAFGYTQLMPVVVGLALIYGLYRVSLYTHKKYSK